MIKGINRQVIEVRDTGSIYYEQAWFMVRPEYTRMQHNVLEKEARSIIKKTGAPSCTTPKRNLLFWATRLGASAVTGSLVTAAIIWWLS